MMKKFPVLKNPVIIKTKLFILVMKNIFSFFTSFYFAVVLCWSYFLIQGHENDLIKSIIMFSSIMVTFMFNFLFAVYFFIKYGKGYSNDEHEFPSPFIHLSKHGVVGNPFCFPFGFAFLRLADILIYADSNLVRDTLFIHPDLINKLDKEHRRLIKDKSFYIILIDFFFNQLPSFVIAIQVLSEQGLKSDISSFNNLKNSALLSLVTTIFTMLANLGTILWKIRKIRKGNTKKDVELVSKA